MPFELKFGLSIETYRINPMELYFGDSLSVLGKDEKLKVIAMLIDKEFIAQPAPEQVWMEAVDNSIATESAPTTKVIRSRVRKLRRMQSQNFVQRAFYDAASLFGLHRETA